jgi:hypothetical protein
LQVLVSFRPAVRVEHVKIAVKAEERPNTCGSNMDINE